MFKSKLEIQTLNYWQACQWLSIKTSTDQKKRLALAWLKKQETSHLGYISELAGQYVDTYESSADQFSLWKGMVS